MRKALAFAVLLAAGCTHHVHMVINPNAIPAERHKTWVNGWLGHLVGGDTNAAQFCGDRPVASIDTRQSFGNHLVSWLTFGIYTPMHATITCGQAPLPQPQMMYAPQPYPAQPPAAPYQPPPYPPQTY